jgi:hypothetical protein
MILKLKLKDMYNLNDSFDEKAYPRDVNESFMFFMKRYGFLVEMTPLNSKARSHRENKLLKEALKGYLVPTEMIREYYGDEVAIYFEWMNHFIKWLIPAGIVSFFIGVINMIAFPTGDSPLSGIFSVGMSIWATMFVIFWKRHCKELNV